MLRQESCIDRIIHIRYKYYFQHSDEATHYVMERFCKPIGLYNHNERAQPQHIGYDEDRHKATLDRGTIVHEQVAKLR